MNTDFQQKVKEYQAIKDADEQKAEQLLNELRQGIQKMAGGVVLYAIDNRTITISAATIDELCTIFEDLNKKESATKLSSISDSERDKQTSKNQYGPNNPYPGKYNFNNA